MTVGASRARSGWDADGRTVLFVGATDDTTSQMAAGLMRRAAPVGVTVRSAGSRSGGPVNALAVASLLEVGVDITDQRPRPVTRELVAVVDLVVVLTMQAVVPYGGTPVVRWEVDEPFERGISGMQRMRLVRDDLARRTDALAAELTDRLTDAHRGGTHEARAPCHSVSAAAPRHQDRPACRPPPGRSVRLSTVRSPRRRSPRPVWVSREHRRRYGPPPGWLRELDAPICCGPAARRRDPVHKTVGGGDDVLRCVVVTAQSDADV